MDSEIYRAWVCAQSQSNAANPLACTVTVQLNNGPQHAKKTTQKLPRQRLGLFVNDPFWAFYPILSLTTKPTNKQQLKRESTRKKTQRFVKSKGSRLKAVWPQRI